MTSLHEGYRNFQSTLVCPPLPPPLSSHFFLSGCYEGIRLSDGQRGWFPAANVMEITNEHVRRRNLRERYRVMQAATMVASTKGNTLHKDPKIKDV